MKAQQMTRPQNDYMDSQIGVKHDVLDFGYIKLLDYMSTEDCLAENARQSYGDGTTKVSTNFGLIKRLIRDKHTSPIEMSNIKIQVKLPVFVERQWIRHRTAHTCEYSGRYSLMNGEFYTPTLDRMKKQHETNKQGSSSEIIGNPQKALDEIIASNKAAKATYDRLIAQGLTRELARMVLSVNQYTIKTWSIDMHNLMNFMQLRRADDAQWEIQQYANVLCDIVKGWMPSLWDAFEDYRLNSVTLSGKQIKAFHASIENGFNDVQVTEDFCKSVGMSKGEIAETIEKFKRLVG
jgi:thymidylate synthase (FAD)